MPGSQYAHSHSFGPLNSHFMANHTHEINPYAEQASYTPSAFIHRDPGYDAMDDLADASSINDLSEQFRFNVSLRAPTAMVKNLKEIPITYLNKSQAYNISFQDSKPPVISSEPTRYRTYVFVSFEEEEQRAKPLICWQLWKEGRGIDEAYQRGGNLFAVEYVDTFQGSKVHKNRQVQVVNIDLHKRLQYSVRFNFLSTNFSHSKSVKGIPVRLCATTELLSPGEELDVTRDMELAYCKVKLFRDHGAERKRSNDVDHVKKTIEKLKQQVSQAEMGGGFVMRKRGNNASATTKGIDRPSKLAIMREMFSSIGSVSIFALRGDQADDPDLYPIWLSGAGKSVKSENMSNQNTGDLQSAKSMIPSPASTNSSNSPPSTSTKSAKCASTIQEIPPGDQVSKSVLEAVGF
ncbi:CP2 transcription factor [Penicillium brevicompactum]|uniref:CP2 transcription factor n=1 Tax=Penicillium brevicompactum TaxID=5074 RepID=UPI002540E333|nr:CP2 transcription factor [Penicillium brevicompactum]KAJ5337409.1 CP2 transcription factor [Penicillium brevicompactum]